MSDPVIPAVDPAIAPTGQKPWHEGMTPEFIGTLENRGIKDKSEKDVALHFYEAHRNASQALSKFGATDPNRLAVIPKDWNSEAEVAALNSKIIPEKPEAYGLEGDGAAEYAKSLHEAGVTPSAGRKLWKAVQDGKTAAAADATLKTTERNEKLRLEDSQLHINWGPKFDDNLIMAERGAKDFMGLSPDEFKALKEMPGFSRFYEGFLKHAQAIGEDAFTTGGSMVGARSYEQAKAAYDEFMRNPRGADALAYMDKNHPRHKEVRAEVGRLQQIITNAEARHRQESGIAA